MGYLDKIDENKRIVKKCLDMKAYNVGASRSYYCAFIGIKNLLIKCKFDYKSFLSGANQREFSHGTIKHALFKCLLANGKSVRDISGLNQIDNLYKKRRMADYEDIDVTQSEFEDSCRELETILSIIGA